MTVFLPSFRTSAQDFDEMGEEERHLAFVACTTYLWSYADWAYPLIGMPDWMYVAYEDEVLACISYFELQGHIFEPPSSDVEWFNNQTENVL